MNRRLAAFILTTDISFLIYWSLSALDQLGVIAIPPEWMYADYTESRVIAWNWSFVPLDLAFSLTGLAAVLAAKRGSGYWPPLALMSLAFTIAAGLQAVSYWAILGEIDPTWFLPNLGLVIVPLFFLRSLISQSRVPAGAIAT